ncbi:hypothetical protein Salat_0615300 [Sesamum alatum]|uniref:DUF3741 domain-containing protein n=1 Tax=Sesamum alatum TaxID=300844 RepID=A0AAE2CU21_9LAMI|nr:hypothetical protein Salat_0615300 [Sesamum alatum]
MATKSDFAQKLLTDLRLRKERMAGCQNSSRPPGQTSRVVHGNPGRTSRGARQINAVESAASRTGNTSRRSNGGSRSINIKESSNQIVLYESGQSSRQVRDLSMAIAFAFENSGNLSKIGVSSSNPLVNFFQRFGPRSLHSQKMDLTSFSNHSLSSGQFPTISHIHINEISKGVQKLNQILRSCSDGLNLDRNSIEVGKELLKGAIDLEESLRMLVNLQEASKYGNGARKKSRIKLLEEDEDDQHDNQKTADQWKLDRPRFSFDKPSRNARIVQGATRLQQLALSYPDKTSEQPIGNSEMVLHKRSTSYVQDLSLYTQVKLSTNASSSQTTQEKGRISNVIAKLMGLEEPPEKENSIRMKNDLKEKEGKQGKVSRKNTKSSETLNRENRNESPLSTDKKSILTNNLPPIRDSKVKLKVEKSQETPDGNSKLVNSERNQQRKDLKILGVGVEAVPGPKLATTMMNKQQNHATAPNQVNGLQSFEDSEKKQHLKKEKESKIIESGNKVLVLNTELQQQKAENSKTLKAEEKRHHRIEYKVSSNSTEKRNADKDLPRSQQKPQDQRLLLQERVIRRTGHSEDKRQADQKDQHFQKQNMMAKNHEGQQVESGVASKSKKSTAINLQKKLSREKSAPGNGRSTKTIEKVSMKDPPNRRHQDVSAMIDISNKTASNQENFKKEDQSHYSSPGEPQPDIEKESSSPVLTEEKPIEVSATQKKAIPREVQRHEIPRKIDVLMTRRNATANHLTRSIKQPANMLKDLKQQMHIKNRSSKRMEEASDSQVKEGKTGISFYNASEMTTEPVRQEDKLQNEAEQMIILSNSVADECQIQNIQTISTLNDNCDSTILNPGNFSDDLQTREQPYALKDENKLKQCDQSIGDNEESTEPYKLSQHSYKQFPATAIQEQLTEPEKDLKEILIKSQLFLSTAEALFKLNIPVSFLHVGDHDYEVAEKKLVLDTAYEVMKRKARRYEVTHHPYTKTNISCTKLRSLDNLVKQLCKDLEILKFYGGHRSDVAAGLYEMLNKDIYYKGPDVNSMWDFEWSNMMSMFHEKEEVIRDVERHMINGLLDEITNDLVLITVSV